MILHTPPFARNETTVTNHPSLFSSVTNGERYIQIHRSHPQIEMKNGLFSPQIFNHGFSWNTSGGEWNMANAYFYMELIW